MGSARVIMAASASKKLRREVLRASVYVDGWIVLVR
jgi:hypothetical protein